LVIQTWKLSVTILNVVQRSVLVTHVMMIVDQSGRQDTGHVISGVLAKKLIIKK
jgi:hypothetical protein